MTRRAITATVAGAAAVAALGLGASGALADGSQTITPGAKQKTAILKAFAKPSKPGPARCYTVKISRNAKWLAGATFNERATGCSKWASNGAAVLYGTGNSWYMLTGGSSLAASECTALKMLMGVNGWQDLVGFASGMGCQNVD